jgi:hypothetical protein
MLCRTGDRSLKHHSFLRDSPPDDVLASGFDESASRATTRAGAPSRRLLNRPACNIWLEPDQDASVAKVEDRPRHIRIPMLVDAHRIPVCKPEQLGHAVGVDEIVDVDSLTHAA